MARGCASTDAEGAQVRQKEGLMGKALLVFIAVAAIVAGGRLALGRYAGRA